MDAYNPDYYRTRPMESIDIMELMEGTEAVMHFCICNLYKYLYRRGMKNPELEDLKKARWYLDKYIELLEAGDYIPDPRKPVDITGNTFYIRTQLGNVKFEAVDDGEPKEDSKKSDYVPDNPELDKLLEPYALEKRCYLTDKLGNIVCETNCAMPCEKE